MEITWQVDDGYCGGRPQHTYINDDDLNSFGTEEEKERFIEDSIKEDFDSNISWYEVTRADR